MREDLYTSANCNESIARKQIIKIAGFASEEITDAISIEEPLEIRLVYGRGSNRIQKNISVTMRTPGNDEELALGFLFTENIIDSYDSIEAISTIMADAGYQKNIIQVTLKDAVVPQLNNTERNFYTTSSCGVCGKGSIASIKTTSVFTTRNKPNMFIALETLYSLPLLLHNAQSNFSVTGGIHASGIFTQAGELLLLREDVGRHNALDKLIGVSLLQNSLPLNRQILLLSGRASFELVQKAAMAGISFIAAVGAPSSLAVELAQENQMALVGFLKENRLNIYHLPAHIKISGIHENKN